MESEENVYFFSSQVESHFEIFFLVDAPYRVNQSRDRLFGVS